MKIKMERSDIPAESFPASNVGIKIKMSTNSISVTDASGGDSLSYSYVNAFDHKFDCSLTYFTEYRLPITGFPNCPQKTTHYRTQICHFPKKI
jgi:hypothetical protein